MELDQGYAPVASAVDLTGVNIRISILPQGHALMSLLIAYLGVSKVNLAYERYMSAQLAAGHSFMILRELHQLSITLTKRYHGKDAEGWRRDTKQSIVQLIHETVATLRDGTHAAALARDAGPRPVAKGLKGGHMGNVSMPSSGLDDPMVLVHALRDHLYHGSDAACAKGRGGEGDGAGAGAAGPAEGLQLYERALMINLLHEFSTSYRDLLRLASSGLPFALVQMGRTFTFVWVLTIPFVLTGKDFVQEYPSAFTFVILLTYGFLGLEFLSRMLSNPFGDEIKNDLNIRGMGTAAVVGIEADSQLSMEDFRQGREANKGSKGRPPRFRKLVQMRQDSLRMSSRSIDLGGSQDADDTAYRAMEEGGSRRRLPPAFS